MGEILGIGMTHAPMFQFPDEHMSDILRSHLGRDTIPQSVKAQANWPDAMREEWGTDEGLAAARNHRAVMVQSFRRLREAIDAFNPDAVLIWGDDQYENFQEDIVPAFGIYIYDTLDCLPFRSSRVIHTRQNVWNEAEETVFPVRGHRRLASHLASQLIRREFDLAYAYKPHHHPTLAHAFLRTILYLDYDRRGWPYPVIPFHVNCYGSDLLRRAGIGTDEDAPPAPMPSRCYALGAAVAEIVEHSPWRVVLVGSSSWSHAFLTKKHYGLYPDVDSDRKRIAELQAGEQWKWAELTLEALVDAGQHEFLNWICLAGAMGRRTAEILAWAETYVFNSDKCSALFAPSPAVP